MYLIMRKFTKSLLTLALMVFAVGGQKLKRFMPI